MIEADTNKYMLGNKIKESRQIGDLTEATNLCLKAIYQFPEENFFYLILGDIYNQNHLYDQSIKAYLEYLKRIDNKMSMKNFLKRYTRLKTVLNSQQLLAFQQKILDICHLPGANLSLFGGIEEAIKYDFDTLELNDEIEMIKAILNKKNFVFQEFVDSLNLVETTDKKKVAFILDKVILDKPRIQKTLAADKYSVSIYEKIGEFEKAIQVATSILDLQKDPVIIRSLFRICRKSSNYLAADIVLSKYPDILKLNDFNILYELVYYFESQNDLEQVNNILSKMERSGSDSLPINKTIINFYLKFGMLEKANALKEKIKNFGILNHQTTVIHETKFSQALKESEEGIWSKIQELYSELDHQKQLAAISELTTGISHELGQPITNIRYTIQFYRELLKVNNDLLVVYKVFDSVLEETERMGNLIKRLSPLTSSKSLVQEFNLIQLIKKRINAEEARLKKEKINVNILAEETILMVFDPVKFEQVISNMLINSIYSIKEQIKVTEKNINIRVSQNKKRTSIIFEDTGKGVPFEARRKIFEPFFSTKPPGEGEGLGLFIIWNILKMQGGTITLDPNYTSGARFIINIPR